MVLEVTDRQEDKVEFKVGGPKRLSVKWPLFYICLVNNKQKIYTVFQFFGLNKFSEYIFGLSYNFNKVQIVLLNWIVNSLGSVCVYIYIYIYISTLTICLLYTHIYTPLSSVLFSYPSWHAYWNWPGPRTSSL